MVVLWESRVVTVAWVVLQEYFGPTIVGGLRVKSLVQDEKDFFRTGGRTP